MGSLYKSHTRPNKNTTHTTHSNSTCTDCFTRVVWGCGLFTIQSRDHNMSVVCTWARICTCTLKCCLYFILLRFLLFSVSAAEDRNVKRAKEPNHFSHKIKHNLYQHVSSDGIHITWRELFLLLRSYAR